MKKTTSRNTIGVPKRGLSSRHRTIHSYKEIISSVFEPSSVSSLVIQELKMVLNVCILSLYQKMISLVLECTSTTQSQKQPTPPPPSSPLPQVPHQSGSYSNLDLPVALHKGTHSSTQHLFISLLISPCLSSVSLLCEFLTSIFVPHSHVQALTSLAWKSAMDEDMSALHLSGTCSGGSKNFFQGGH